MQTEFFQSQSFRNFARFVSLRCRRCLLLSAFGFLLLAFLLTGCSHRNQNELGPTFIGTVSTPQPPPFLNGACAVLLTNVPGFSARVTMYPGVIASENLSGQLLGHGTKLVFAPDLSPAVAKKSRASAVTFIWDVPRNSGYVLNESLQAYAPWSSDLRFTNVTEAAGATLPEKVNGHLCRESRISVDSTGAYTSSFSVWRAPELQNFPVRITSATNPATLNINFSNVQLKEPPADIFVVPDSFTKYASVEAMMTELVLRQQNLKRPVTGDWTPSEPVGGPAGNRPPER